MKKNHFLLLFLPVGIFSLLVTGGYFQLTINQAENLNLFPEEMQLNFQDSNEYMGLLTALDNPYFYTRDDDHKAYLYVATRAARYEPENTSRTPLNISIVIDRSGSMRGSKIDYVKKAAIFMIDQLGNDDYISIVTYDDVVDVLHESSKVDNKEHIKRKIEGITSRGMTNLGGGMAEGYNQVKKNYNSGYVNRVLLLSDGLANVGITHMEKLQQIARIKSIEEGMSLSTFGVGLDFNENLMTGLAEHGSGYYYFISNPEDIPGIFEKELMGLLKVVAQNARMIINLPRGIKLDQLFGQKYDQKGNTITVVLNDIFAEETKAVLLRFSINDNAGDVLTFNSKLTYNDAVESRMEQKELSAVVKLSKTDDTEVYKINMNERVVEQAVLFESNYLLEQAMMEFDKRNYDKAREILEENTRYLKEYEQHVNNNPELQKQLEVNQNYEEQMKNAEMMDEVERKRVQKSTKSQNYNIRNYID